MSEKDLKLKIYSGKMLFLREQFDRVTIRLRKLSADLLNKNYLFPLHPQKILMYSSSLMTFSLNYMLH